MAGKAGQFFGQDDGGFDGTDAGRQRRDAGAQEDAVLGIRGHDEEDILAGDRFHLIGHPEIPSRPRMTIIVLVIEAISLAGPSVSA